MPVWEIVPKGVAAFLFEIAFEITGATTVMIDSASITEDANIHPLPRFFMKPPRNLRLDYQFIGGIEMDSVKVESRGFQPRIIAISIVFAASLLIPLIIFFGGRSEASLVGGSTPGSSLEVRLSQPTANGETTTYIWLRGAMPIFGSNASTYTLSNSDVGKRIWAIAITTAPNQLPRYASTSESAPIQVANVTVGTGGGSGGGGGGAPAAAGPQSKTPVYFLGKIVSQEVLTANVGSWEQQENIIFKYQWHRCSKELIEPDASTVQLNCSPIFAAEQSKYIVTDSDVSKYLLLEVLAKDKTGVLIAETKKFSNSVLYGSTAIAPAKAQPGTESTDMKTWAKRLNTKSAKLYAKNVVGAGKVSFIVNGKEVAWVNAKSLEDKKLRVVEEGPMAGNSYLVRTIKLQKGKNTLEVYVDGVRTTRTVYSLG